MQMSLPPSLSLSHSDLGRTERAMKNERHNMQISSERIKVHRGGAEPVPNPISDGEKKRNSEGLSEGVRGGIPHCLQTRVGQCLSDEDRGLPHLEMDR